jgi:predicted dehydrogenase
VIGCGFLAQTTFIPGRSSVRALPTSSPLRPRPRQGAAASFNVPRWCGSAERLFAAEKPDRDDVITQMNSHKALAGLAVDPRVATSVQKPFGPDLAACKAMLDHAGKAGVFLALHENFRFQRPMREI